MAFFGTTRILLILCSTTLILFHHLTFADILTTKNENEIRLITSIGGSLSDDLCDTLSCGKGEECTVKERVARCQCKKSCPKAKNSVCASNGKTYPSHCHFYMTMCYSKLRFSILHKGSCEDQLPVKSNNESLLSDEPLIPTIEIKHQLITGNSTEIPKGQIETTSFVTTLATTTEQQHCEHDDFVFIPSNLLLYFHAKFAENSRGEVEHGKTYLVHLMLANFDVDGDKVLTKSELDYSEKDERYTKLMPPGCHLSHLIQYGDLDGNGELSNKEFYSIFGLSTNYLPHNKEIKPYFVEIDKQYQLYCDIDVQNNPNARITWYRYDVPLVNVVPYNFEVSADGSLYLTPALLLHSGNFTCRVGADPTLVQKHIVHVQERPVVEVEPQFLLLKSGENGKLRCIVKKGYPMPKIAWEKNSVKIAENVTTLDLLNLNPQDTGSYKCIATNSISSNYATASVIVREDYQQPELYLREAEREKSPQLAVLHKNGINIFNVFDCSLSKMVFNVKQNLTDEISKLLCQDPQKSCQWADGVITNPPNFIYAALREQRLLVKINASAGTIDEIFRLNHMPARLWYVSWEDSVWIESWHDKSGHYRTVQVIRSASKSIRHALTHALPTHEEYDSVEHLFLPIVGELNYGYVTHWQELALHKFDLKSLKIVSRLSLAPYDCHPSDVEFIAQSGLVVVNCVKGNGTLFTGQLLIDYMSDSVLNYDTGIYGKPLASPDGQVLVTIDSSLGRIFVQKISGKELKFWQTVDEYLPLADWSMYPSLSSNSWMLHATSIFSNQLITVNITSGKVEKNANVGYSLSSVTEKGHSILALVESHYVVVSTQNGLSVVDLYKSDSVLCRIMENVNETKIVIDVY